MTDPPQQTSDGERASARGEQLVRLVSDTELDRLEARREHLTQRVDELETENSRLRQEIATLRHRLEQKDQQRQQVIDNYERLLAEERTDSVDDERRSLDTVFFWRSRREK
jgi:chaperonin cofactor prefoldin